MSWQFQRPSATDLPAVRDFLAAVDLPSEDIAEHFDHFLVVWNGKQLAGVVGMEIRDGGGLLRSLAVDTSHRGTGLGKALTREMLTRARSFGVVQVGLLTTTAEKFFAKQGFMAVSREDIPEWIKTSKEFRVYCPSTAVCMMRNLES